MSDLPTTYVPDQAKLVSLGFAKVEHAESAAIARCEQFTRVWGSDYRSIITFPNGQVFIQQKSALASVQDITHWQSRLPTEKFFEQLLDAIGWLPPNYVRPLDGTEGLTVAQLLDWPAGLGGVSNDDFLRVRAQLNAHGWDVLTREQQLMYLVGQQSILGELYAATHAEQKKLIQQLQQHLREAEQELQDLATPQE